MLLRKVGNVREGAVDVLPDRGAEVEVRKPRLPRRAAIVAQRVDPRRLGRRDRIPLTAGTVRCPAPVGRDEEALAQIVVASARGG
jgi:hypothetical protein